MNPQPKAQLGKRYSDFSASMQERTLTNIADRIISMPIDHAAFLNRGHTVWWGWGSERAFSPVLVCCEVRSKNRAI